MALAEYAGTYKNDLYGDVKITHENEKLGVRFGPAFTGSLEHWHYDTFRAKFVAPGCRSRFHDFRAKRSGQLATLTLNLPGVAEYPFKRAPETATAIAVVPVSDRELKKFAGKYELKTPPVEVSVEIVGGKLKAILPGQPVYSSCAGSRESLQY